MVFCSHITVLELGNKVKMIEISILNADSGVSLAGGSCSTLQWSWLGLCPSIAELLLMSSEWPSSETKTGR